MCPGAPDRVTRNFDGRTIKNSSSSTPHSNDGAFGMIGVDFKTLGLTDVSKIYKIMIGSVVPRPIALISTVNSQGKGNLAPFSFFNGVSSNPPCFMVAIARKPDGSKKDTLLNLESNKECVVHIVNEAMAGPMNQTSAPYPYGIDELLEAKFTALPSVKVKPVRVKESPIHFECKLRDSLDVGGAEAGASTIVVLEIVWAHFDPRVYKDGKIDIHELAPLSRLAGHSYGKLGDIFDLPRPTVS